MVDFFNISLKVILIIVYLFCSKTDCLILKYGFENQPEEEVCQHFPLYTFDRHLILKGPKGAAIWSYINPGNSTGSTSSHFVNASLTDYFVLLCFRNLTRTDIGNYRLEEVKSKKTFTFFIDVYYEAKIRKVDVESLINEYDDVNLTCQVDSNPPADIKWILPKEINHKVHSDGKSSTLYIANSTCEHTGIYFCLATNKKDTFDKEDLFLNITCGPTFANIKSFHDVRIYTNVRNHLEFNINFTANPYPIVITDGNVNATIISYDAVHYTLFIHKFILNDGDFKMYTIRMRNSVGAAKLILYIMQQEIEKSVNRNKIILTIGIALPLILFVGISFVIYQLAKTWKRRKENKRINESVHYVNTAVGIDQADSFSFEDESPYQNRIREIELEAAGSYEDLSITEDNTSYQEIRQGYKVTGKTSERESKQSGGSLTENDSIKDDDCLHKNAIVDAMVENVLDIAPIEERAICKSKEKIIVPVRMKVRHSTESSTDSDSTKDDIAVNQNAEDTVNENVFDIEPIKQ